VNIVANENLYDPMVEALRAAGHNVLDAKRSELVGVSSGKWVAT
jgi:hypothetical protein